VVAEDTSIDVDAVGEIPKRHAVQLAFFAIKAVDGSGCESECDVRRVHRNFFQTTTGKFRATTKGRTYAWIG
jgi:hypothetical protein